MLAAFAFPFCFQFLLAAFCAAMLMVSCLLFSGIERVRAFKFPLLLDPGFFEHAVHVWKGKLAKDESEENVFLLNSGATSFQVRSCGILDGFLLAPGVREFWKEGHWSIIDNDDRDAVVEISEHQFVAAAALGTCRSQPEKLEDWSNLVKSSSSSSRGSEVLRLRWSGEEVMLHWAWLLESWVWFCMPWLEGRL